MRWPSSDGDRDKSQKGSGTGLPAGEPIHHQKVNQLAAAAGHPAHLGELLSQAGADFSDDFSAEESLPFPPFGGAEE